MIRFIVGLGNPGEKYRNTRHNIGFLILDQLAENLGLVFKSVPSLQGELAKGIVRDRDLFLLKPMTYMNLSGQSLKKTMDYYKIAPSETMIVADDIYVPFGRFRLRPEGGAGGHNGLKSIIECIGSPEIPRLRVGIGQDPSIELADYVLSTYRKEESEALPKVLKEAALILDKVVELGIEKTLQYANSSEIGVGEQKNG